MNIPNVHFLNSILVDAEVRPAMLIQPIDVGECASIDKITAQYLKNIKRQFPHLKYSDDYSCFQGIIVSKHNEYNGQTNIGSERIGEILGYPSSADFELIISNENDPYSPELDDIYNIEVVVDTNDDDTIQLFGNRCIGNSKLGEYREIAKKAEAAFKDAQYADLVSDIGICSVRVVCNRAISVKMILDNIVTTHTISHDYIDEVVNYMWNLNDPSRLSEFIIDHIYEPTNETHTGMLMMILLNCSPKYNRERVIYGYETKELMESNAIRVEWFEAIIKLFKKTRTRAKQYTRLFTRLRAYISGTTTMLPESSDPMIQVMTLLVDNKPLTSQYRVEISDRLRNISDINPQTVPGILSMFDYTNQLHRGMMLILLLELIPTYDTTLPLQRMNSSSIEYQQYKDICEVWLDNVYLLFSRTTSKRIGK
jgi:hypothetical protein